MKPCPYKHRHPEFTPDTDEYKPRVMGGDYWFYVFCPVCKSVGPEATSEEEAWDLWENRI
jgi:hypothetical protein